VVGGRRGNCVAAKGWSATIDTLQKEREKKKKSFLLNSTRKFYGLRIQHNGIFGQNTTMI
jgi:hypothetical protein